MAAVVSTRIIRLQAISPRVSAANLPSSISAVTLASTQGSSGTPGSTQVTIYWNAAANQWEFWKDNEFKFIPAGANVFTITLPTLSLTSAVPGVSVATSAPAVVGPYSATPPTLSLDTLVPGVSVSAHSP